MANILIVEDDLLLRRTLTLRLARHGHSVAEADNVATAREAIQAASAPFDLILLDINLPDGTGWDLLREQPHTPGTRHQQVIVMSAARPLPRRRDEFQPAAILLKPFPLVTLLHFIERKLAHGTHVEPHRDEATALDTPERSEHKQVRTSGD